MRSGADYVAGLRDGRAVFLDGERVGDVTRHPWFAPQIERIAAIYDLERERPALHSVDPASGERYSNMWLAPLDPADLAARRAVHEFWAECSYGLMGRTPDHVACFLTGMAAAREVFDRKGKQFGDNVVRTYERARRESLYFAYVVVPPQIDRAKSAAQQPEPFLYPGVVEERDGGIVVRGAQMIGTSAVMADELFLSYIVPLARGDEDYAISVVMPMNAPGLKLYPRRPYAATATSVFDYPLSSRLDETDSLVVFDDVLVPWENVFVYKDVGLLQSQFHETAAHLLGNYQAVIRFVVKWHFAAGLAAKLAELHNIAAFPPVQAQLGGSIAAQCSVMEALAAAAAIAPVARGNVLAPNPQYVYTAMDLQRQWCIDLMRALRELAGGSWLAVPSSAASLTSPLTAPDVERYYQSKGVSAHDRVKFLKLMWDFVGTEMAGRQWQYEMFYSAAQHVADTRVYKNFDWAACTAMVESALAEYDLQGEIAPLGRRSRVETHD